ncbi:hypothetical protein DXG01_016929 [Tephrocybe rancida]|nr:hypothetical protein DXG01_016929 [Tephrocybe rancida]
MNWEAPYWGLPDNRFQPEVPGILQIQNDDLKEEVDLMMLRVQVGVLPFFIEELIYPILAAINGKRAHVGCDGVQRGAKYVVECINLSLGVVTVGLDGQRVVFKELEARGRAREETRLH